MRNWKTVFVASCMLLAVGAFCWAEDMGKVAPGGGPVPLWEPLGGATITEGFEGGVVPPDGWTLIQTNPNETWKIMNVGTPHSGGYAADVEYDVLEQDEVLISPTINPVSAALEFYSFGNLYWCRDTYNQCDLEIWLVRGDWDGGAGDDIYLGLADNDWTATWTWSHTSMDLTPFLPGGPVRVAFRYVGRDGAQVALDDIQLGYEPAPPTEAVPALNHWGVAVMTLLLATSVLLRFRKNKAA